MASEEKTNIETQDKATTTKSPEQASDQANPQVAKAAKPNEAAPKAKAPTDPRAKLYQPDHALLIIGSSPHLSTTASVPTIMWNVVAALMPAVAMAIYFFGGLAVGLLLTCTLSALATEALINKMKGQALSLNDGSAAITGLLLALTLPPSLPLSTAALGSIFAIALGKHVFGGLGYNIFNPALIGRAFLQASFPVAMTTWTYPATAQYASVDAVSAATPLGLFKFEHISSAYLDMFTGNIGGSLGETSAIAIVLGGLYLLVKKYADWRIPLSFLSTVFIFTAIFWLFDSSKYPDPVFYVLSGGLLLGAFFMATDMVTSPITPRGAWIFGIGAGVLLVVIRIFGGLPEGVMYAILLMNAATPLINRYTRPKFFGELRA